MRLEELTGHQVAFAPLLDAAQTIDHFSGSAPLCAS